MYDKIIVPVDDSLESRAVRVASDLANRMAARLELVSIVSHGLQHRTSASLTDVARRLGDDVDVRVVEDDEQVPLPEQLCHLAAEPGALMCLDTKARRRVGEVLLGSIGEEVIRRSEQPLLAVGPASTGRLTGTTVKVALDGTPESESVVAAATDLAGALHADLAFVLVADPLHAADQAATLQEVARRLAPAAHESAFQVLESRDVRRALVETFNAPDTVVGAMVTHGPSKIERLIVGSVVLDVLRQAQCPVMVSAPRPVAVDA